MEQNKKNKTIIGIIIASTVLVLVVTISYAYTWADKLTNEPLDVTASTATMKLRYTDCEDGDLSTCGDISANLAPGNSITKDFKISNVGTLETKYSLVFRELQNTFVNDELVFTLENLTTNTTLVDEEPVPSGSTSDYLIYNDITSPVGSVVRYRLTVKFLNKDYNQEDNSNAEFSLKLGIKDAVSASAQTLAHLGLTSNGVKDSFDEPATTDEGIFEMEDDYGISYYFRGAVENNYVKFGQNESKQDMYWRIVRINGDGSLRIIYDGDQPYANVINSSARFIGTSAYNKKWDDNKYVGYMYGPAGTTASTSKTQAQGNTESSTIKTVVDEWFKTNIVDTGYSESVVDVLFCNDRSTPGKTSTETSWDTGLGYGQNETAFGAYARMKIGSGYTAGYIGAVPTFKCPQQNDAFTVEDTTKGNGALDYPAGLITADEVIAAGSGKFITANSNYYLYKGSNYWSLSPSYTGSYDGAIVFDVGTDGCLNDIGVYTSSLAVAPVINLNPEYVNMMIGSGTMTDPYRS